MVAVNQTQLIRTDHSYCVLTCTFFWAPWRRKKYQSTHHLDFRDTFWEITDLTGSGSAPPLEWAHSRQLQPQHTLLDIHSCGPGRGRIETHTPPHPRPKPCGRTWRHCACSRSRVPQVSGSTHLYHQKVSYLALYLKETSCLIRKHSWEIG